MTCARLLATVSAVALLAVPAPAGAASFVARLDAPGHHPKGGHTWTIRVAAHTSAGKPLHATAFYRFVYRGQVVSTQYPSPHRPPRHAPWPFYGSFSDPIFWPRRSAGYALTFRVVVRVKGRGSQNLDYAVRVGR